MWCLLFSFWFFKFAAAAAITIGSFFISEGPFTTGNYSALLSVLIRHGVSGFFLICEENVDDMFGMGNVSIH